jgi:Protein of unknown function (DUF3761)
MNKLLSFALASALLIPTLSTYAADAPKTVTCMDGTSSKGGQGACSGHGGINKDEKRTAPPAGATARCKDGTYYTQKEHQGACGGHGGVAEWLDK